MKIRLSVLSFTVSIFLTAVSSATTVQWSRANAETWGRQNGWIVGANYIPSNAVNQIEMWQQETFSPKLIDQELGWAEAAGMKSLRVFLHDLVWQEDPVGYAGRIDAFLEIASRHKIRPILVFFDSCWNPHPHAGRQPAPTPGVHNSQWVQSPGVDALMNVRERPRLQAYVKGVMRRFANDRRILAWDLWNEPDNLNSSSSNDTRSKIDAVARLLPEVFRWARAADVDQPLTSGVWAGDWSANSHLNPIQKIQLTRSDIVSFHSYDSAEVFEKRILQLKRFKRPILCTEYMARPFDSRVEKILPVAKAGRVSSFNWGFVAGRSQTYFPWDSWQNPYPSMPAVWFHDLFYTDGRPFDPAEIQFLRTITR